MADTKISALPARTSVFTTDEVATVAGGVNYRSPISSIVSLVPRAPGWVNVADYGLIADGGLHPLSSRYGSLAAAQVDYPFATSLTQQIDYCACKKASNVAFGGDLELEVGAYTAVSSASDAGHVVDATKAWVTDEHRHKFVYRKKLSGAVDYQQIMNNTATTLTLGTVSTPANLPGGVVDATDTYAIVYRVTGTNGTTTTIIDLTQNWTVNQHAGKVAFRRFTSSGGGSTGPTADSAPILSNTKDTLTLAAPMPSAVLSTQIYAIGYGENGTDSHRNKPLWLPPGIYMFGTDTWTIRNLVGARIQGSGEQTTVIKGNNCLLRFDGLWYTSIADFSLQVQVANINANPLAPIYGCFEIDGNVPGHPYPTRGVQGVTCRNLLLDGGGSDFVFGFNRLGGNSGQGDQCVFEKVHMSRGNFACYYQVGFNSLSNVFISGQCQSYPRHGLYSLNGSFSVFGTAFQSTTGYKQVENGGYDIYFNGGAYAGVSIYGVRSESLQLLFGGAVSIHMSGCDQRPALGRWQAGVSYGTTTNQYLGIIAPGSATRVDGNPYTNTKGRYATNRLFVAGTGLGGAWVKLAPGAVMTSGPAANEPEWNEVDRLGTVQETGGSGIVWKETPFDAINAVIGSIDWPNGIIIFAGEVVIHPKDWAIRQVTSDTIMNIYEDGIYVDATAGPVTISSPYPTSGTQRGKKFWVKKVDVTANPVTVHFVGSGPEGVGVDRVIPGGSRGYREYVYGLGTLGTTWWLDTSQEKETQQVISTDAAFTLTPETSPRNTRHTGTLTADRAVNLSLVNAYAGLTYRITRTGGGAFNLTVGTGPLKALATNQWCEVTHDGTAWYLSAYGTL